MDRETLVTFLTIVSTNSVSRAAEQLYVSQSSVSKRLQQLETELGVSLIVRKKGTRGIELTPAGLSFLPMAEQIIELCQQSVDMNSDHGRTRLSIACIDSLNASVLAPVYRRLLQQEPMINLSITTNLSAQIYHFVEQYTCDIGFVTVKLQHPNIIVEPFIQQYFKLIYCCHGKPDLTSPVATEVLDPTKEIFQPWGSVFYQWHERHFPGSKQYVRFDTVSMMPELLEDGYWTIVPDTIADTLRNTPHLHVFEIQNPPPYRNCYKINNLLPRKENQRAIELFESILNEDSHLSQFWRP